MKNASAGESNDFAPSADQVATAEDLIKDILRNRPLILFHCDEIYSPQDSTRLRRILGLEQGTAAQVRTVIAAAIAKAGQTCPGLKISIRTFSGQEEITGFDLQVEGETEWSDALRYAHGTQSNEALTRLSEPAEELLTRIESGEFADFTKELSIRRRLRFYGWSSRLETILQEILVKRGIRIQIEDKGKTYSQREHFLKFSIAGRNPPGVPPPSLNPVVPPEVFRVDCRRPFIRWFFQMIVDAPFDGAEPRNLWHLSSRAEFFRCFPALRQEGKVTPTITKLLAVVRPVPHFQVGWNFSHDSVDWFVTIGPRKTWAETKEVLRQELARPSSEVQYGLTSAAACLYDWIQALDEKAFECRLTPVVEKAIEKSALLLDSPWSDDNFLTFITLLCEEVTERTPLDLRPMTWRNDHDRDPSTRIRVRPHRMPTSDHAESKPDR